MSEDKIVKKIHNDLIVKSIEREINYAIKCDYDTVMLYVDDIKELLSLYYQEQKKNDDYKMQDKEYQKLKEIVSSNQQLYSAFSFGRKYEKEMYKNKIKKEIEEIRKTHAPEDDYSESQIYILQSLLNEEE